MEPVPPAFRGLLGALLSFLLAAAAVAAASPADACTSILVTPGASADGSTTITYSCDLAGLYATLGILPAADHKPGEMIEIAPRSKADKRPPGKIPQVPHTYKLLGWMNEHQLVIAETTFGGRPELVNPQGLLDCAALMTLGLQRARMPRGHWGDGQIGERIRLWRRGRIVLHRRREGSLDHGDRRGRARRQGRRLGGGADSRRANLLSRQLRASARFPATIRPLASIRRMSRASPPARAGTMRSRAGGCDSATPIARRRRCRGGSAMRGCGASCDGRRRRNTCRPTITAPSPARRPIRCRCRQTRNSPPPTSSP